MFREKQNVDEFCLEEALTACEPLSKPAKTEFDTAINWGTEYRYCQLKHDILIHCVEEHGD